MNCDLAVALLAEKRHGVVTRAQALRIGLSSSAIERRLRLGAWERLHDGVYRLAGTPRSWEQSVLAACRAASPGAVASHRAAATILSLPGVEKRIEITVPESRRIRVVDVEVHRAVRLDRADRWVCDHIPVTSLARTVIDLAGVLEGDGLTAVLDHVLGHRSVPLSHLRSRLDALGCQGRKGTGALAALLGERATPMRAPESGFEWLLLRTLAGAGLPAPRAQFAVRLPNGRKAYIDFAYPGALLAIEADSYVHHSSLTDWSRDHVRNNELVAVGWRILPVTYQHLETRPAAVADQIRRALGAGEDRRNFTA